MRSDQACLLPYLCFIMYRYVGEIGGSDSIHAREISIFDFCCYCSFEKGYHVAQANLELDTSVRMNV